MVTLVSVTDLKIADRVGRTKLSQFRASFGDIKDYRQIQLQLARGDFEVFDFERFMYAWFRDKVDITITSPTDPTQFVVMPQVVGTFIWPTAGKLRISVDANSTISLERVVHLIYS